MLASYNPWKFSPSKCSHYTIQIEQAMDDALGFVEIWKNTWPALNVNFHVQISYASSAEVLSNRFYYPSYFRTSPSEVVLTPGLANLVQHFGWRQVTFITEEERLFQDVSCLYNYKVAINFCYCTHPKGPQLTYSQLSILKFYEKTFPLLTDSGWSEDAAIF